MIPLATATHDRLAHRRDDADWLARAWADPATRVLPIGGTRVDVGDGRLPWTGPEETPEGQRVLLGESDGAPRFAVIGDPSIAGPQGQPLRGLLPLLTDADASLVVHALGLAEWQWATRYCARCGGGLTVRGSGHVLVCADCGRSQFPRLDPAVIMLITDEHDRALLGRQPSWPPQRWSTLAGFVEPGESLEQAVRREVAEESGVVVGEVAYMGSQPWPLPSSLMLAFTGRATRTAITVDDDEIEDARWFSRDDLVAAHRAGEVEIPPGISISRALITQWCPALPTSS